ncbi:MAG TPA: aldo/keto reductase [Phycisphaerales bacterium]|nr:aldo/keto reductase [Phycisphaerales bacterium]HCD33248.1 aldo/keto reductase [Phycisphaerales bacterium]
MKYRRLGKTDMNVSVIGVGTWQFGGEWGKNFEQSEVNDMFAAAKDCGINLIDTAECYGDHLSEEFIGAAIEGNREDWIVATKFGHKFHDLFTRDTIYEPAMILQQLEDSLKALRTDYIDLYQFHSGNDEMFQTEGLWELLQKQVELGKIRHLGISIGSNQNIFQTERASSVNAKTIQVVYNRLDRAPEEQVLPECIKQDLGVLARVPLASGFLSGKYTESAAFDKTDVRGNWMDDKARLDKITQAIEIKKTEVPEGVNMAQWALAWVLTNPAVTTVIPGCKTVEQVKSNAAAADLQMVSTEHPQAC